MNRTSFSVAKFSARLKALRLENGLTLEELSTKLAMKYDYNTNKGVISKYENGKHEPNLYFVDIVSDLFGVSMDYLSGKSDVKQQSECLPQCKYIPIVGTIAAGVPMLAQQNIEGYECIDGGLKADYCLRVKGDSMIDAGIKSGDIVYIHTQSDVESGEIAVVLVGGEEATLKRVFKVPASIILHAENPRIPDRLFTKKDMNQIKIQGKAISVRTEVF